MLSWRTLTRRVEEVWGDTVVNHHRRFLHQRMLVVLAATTLTLAGCTSKGDNKPSPTPSTTSATSSDSSSPSAPGTSSPSASISVDIPEAARAHTDAGAIEFAKFIILLGDRGMAANTDREFLALTLPGCKRCALITEGVASQISGDWRPAGTRVTISGAQLYGPYAEDHATIDLLGSESAIDLISTSGAVVGRAPETVLRLRLDLIWSADGWRLSEMQVVNV